MKPKRFNYTYALPEGAWIEYDNGSRYWEPIAIIIAAYGFAWFQRHAQGQFTGCWIDCV